MSESWTPGPWRFYDENGEIRSAANELISDIDCSASIDSEVIRNATAHLIASAPALYEACMAFIEAWERSHQLEKTDVALRLAKVATEAARGGA